MTKLNPLKVTVEQLQSFKNEEYILFAKCGVTKKEIRINGSGGMELWHGDTKLFESLQTNTIVDEFNKINTPPNN